MSISYRLDQAASVPLDTAAATLVAQAREGGVLAPDTTAAAVLGRGVELRSGAVVNAGPRTPHPIDVVAEDLGFAPTVWWSLAPSGEGELSFQIDELLWVALTVLTIDPGDAVLHFQYEQIWLLRRGGALVLSDDDAIWTPARLAHVPVAYERRPLRFPSA